MQPLAGRFGKDSGRDGRAGSHWSGARYSITLKTAGRWHKASRGRGRRRAPSWLPSLLGRGRIGQAALLTLFATAAGYGLLQGGYMHRSAGFVADRTSSVAVKAGFAIRKLTIEGQERTSDQEIVKALRIGAGESMLSFDSAAAQSRLERLPWVKSAQVMRLLPSRLHVVIVERAPFAVWQHNGELKLISSDGTVIAPIAGGAYGDLPLVVGAGAPDRAGALYEALAAHPGLRKQVKAAVRVAERRWTLQLLNGIEIRLPEEDVSWALNKTSEIERSHGLLSQDVVAVDLRIPGRVTVRLGKEAAAKRDTVFAPPGGAKAPGRDT